MKLKYHVPLIGFLVPTFVISTFMFVCRGCPPLDQLIGFYVCVAGAVVTYYTGIHTGLKDRSEPLPASGPGNGGSAGNIRAGEVLLIPAHQMLNRDRYGLRRAKPSSVSQTVVISKT